MEIRNKLAVLMERGRNFLAHHRRTWLPYGVIMLCLAGIWFCWDGAPSSRHEVIREKKNSHSSSSPVFSASETVHHEDSIKGELLCSAAQTQRRRPLPDLFDGSLPKKAANTKLPAETQAKPAAASTQNMPKPPVYPVLQGILHQGHTRLAFLAQDGKTKVCAVGEEFAGYRVAYIQDQAVGLYTDKGIVEIRR